MLNLLSTIAGIVTVAAFFVAFFTGIWIIIAAIGLFFGLHLWPFS